jgi:hypothetical protein
MYYYLILILQGFCIYHAIKNRNNYYWIFLILFLPVIGAVIYLVTQVYNKNDANKIQEEITSILIPTKKVKDLEKQLAFSETYQNRVNLADAYLEMKDYNNAITHYEFALKDKSQKGLYVIKQLVKAYYGLKNYKKVIKYAEQIKGETEFENSKAQFIYGLALEEEGATEIAETTLKKIDLRYSNYQERLILAKFLVKHNKQEEAKSILNEILIESQNMTKPNRKRYRETIQDVQKLIQTL